MLVAVLAMSAGTVWGQTNRTLGDIPDGWTVQANGSSVTVTDGTATIPSGYTVTLTPMYPAKVKSVKLKDEGLLNGKFTINAGGTQVYFSQGNLQAVCSSADNDASTQETWTWQFATNQWDYVGYSIANTSINGNGSVFTTGTVDLFGWVGTSSSYDNYGIHNNTTASDYGNTSNESLKHDWGHNAIANGGNSADMWRTLTRDEWWYMLNTRSGATVNGTDNVRFAKATIRTDETEVKGVILFPDGTSFEASEASWNDLNNGYNNYTTTCTAAQWTALEAKGCVFLPAASIRTGATVSNESSTGAYWTATGSNQSGYYTWAHMVYFTPNTWSTSSSYKEKSYGLSVRLVKVVPHAVDLSTLTGDYEAQDGDILINTLAGNYKITIADRATVTLRNATINGTNNNSYQWAGITCLGDATIVLEGTNTVKGFHHYYPGIQAAHNGTGSGDEYTLTIKGDGSLTASSNSYYGDFCAAGIGAGNNNACGNILIESGTIAAESGLYHGAGIGGAKDASCGTITITGGTVTATGGQYGAGIGSGSATTSNPSEFCAAITITGGTVTANGGENGAGIGSGYRGKCQSISITGGTVIVTGYGDGAGIGSGKDGSCSTITIADGVTQVTATKGSTATNSIGKGAGTASCGTVTIGGTVYYNGTNYENEGATYLAQSPLGYPAKVAAAATAGDLGKVIGANGCIYDDAAAATAAGTTALALICYVGSDASNAPYNHGLALALMDANDGNYTTWCSQSSTPLSTCLTTQYNDETAAKTDMAGRDNTLYLNYHAPTGHTHTAASAASDYAVSLPTGTSAWFLPSAGQWEKMINACKNVLGTNNSYVDLRDGFSTRGGTNLKSNYYWSSTEANNQRAWLYKFGDNYSPGEWDGHFKDESYYVRSVIAF